MYKCVSCKKPIAKIEDKLRCPYCGTRIFAKQRAETIKRVAAR